jgi:hypothetical protein
MLYIKADVKDGKIVPKETKVIDQSKLSSDCWLIQFDGLNACKTCEARSTQDCGGGETLKKMKKKSRN